MLETFFPKMHIERDIRKKPISGVSNPHKKKLQVGGGGFNMLFRTSFSNIFRTHTFAASFCNFFPHLPRLEAF